MEAATIKKMHRYNQWPTGTLKDTFFSFIKVK
jgi:hypothetical protein